MISAMTTLKPPSPLEMRLLQLISQHPGILCDHLATLVARNRHNVATLVRRLDAHSLITRAGRPHGRRPLFLTPQGSCALTAGPPPRQEG